MDTWFDHFIMASDNGSGNGSDSKNFEDGIIIFPLYLHLCCTGGGARVLKWSQVSTHVMAKE